MAEIHHQVGIQGSLGDIYHALTTDDGLSTWWTTDTQGAGDVGSVIHFRFDGNGPEFAVTELLPNKLVRWSHSGTMPEEWMGTEITFRLQQKTDQVMVHFSHTQWQSATDFMAHCSTKWGVFMLSLKDAIETGKGRPFPDDIQIDHT
ncbi:MAG: SRPBCC domain-containing protein [Sedimenticola sp.]|uniref:SRPBCC domain-containing protein n=1 Tax=Sedimenticola thiotaurini TaxID=1543721 RepID=A0A558D7H5_9GAMM|nr:SRPBCC domain-containing protein [Sedimenticola sp.]TVT56948.1 MAG: SRPBCC domain-containing protein [Sedimenticola thiotaurini]